MRDLINQAEGIFSRMTSLRNPVIRAEDPDILSEPTRREIAEWYKEVTKLFERGVV